MKHVLRFRWLIIALWVIAATALFLLAPNLQELVREKGQITAPEDAPSQQANELLAQMTEDSDGDTSSAVLVFHDKKGLSQTDIQAVEKAIDRLQENEDSLAISNILDFRKHKEIESQTVSEDGTTIIVPFHVSFSDQEIEQSQSAIYKTLEDIKVDHYLTGEDYINQDIITNSEEGLRKTEIITVGLILVILFIVFRSFVAPLIPLLTVGMSYLAAQGIVAILADSVDFPLSTYTQIFMVAVMFGIGTDYCILIISRYKEELANHESKIDAVIATYQGAGKTILYAAIAVLIGFSTIGLSTFSLYKSAVAVAIGVLVVLIALFTLVPFFLSLLGNQLFWPFHKQVEHKESRIWGFAGKFSWYRPLWALIIVLVITVPAIISYDGTKSYNNLEEIGDSYDTVKGFNLIADHFGPGQAMPVTVYMTSNEPIESRSNYQDIERITAEINKLDGVQEVRSATRPAGDIIEDFLVDEQTDLIADGIKQSTDGLTDVQDGLKEASKEIKAAKPQLSEAEDGINQLKAGTLEAKSGIDDVKKALITIQEGMKSGALGAKEVKDHLTTIKQNFDESISGNKQILKGYQALAKGLKDFGKIDLNTGQFGKPEDLNRFVQALEQLRGPIDAIHHEAIKANPQLQKDETYLRTYGSTHVMIDGMIEEINKLKKQFITIQKELGQLGQLSNQVEKEVIQPLNKLNQNFSAIIKGQEQLSAGIGELIGGLDELHSGLSQAYDGQGQVTKNLPQLSDGLNRILNGQDELKKAFSTMEKELDTLSNGLSEGADGLGKIEDGLTDMKDFLKDFNTEEHEPFVYIPQEALNHEDFIDGTKPYLSDDLTITKWDVVLTVNPYSVKAMDMIDKIEAKTNEAKQDSVFAKSDPKLGGVTSTNYDLQNISDDDYKRTAILMLIGIFIILILLLRSLIMPIYLIGSLIVTYLTSMAFAEFIFVNLSGYDGLTWAVPFFAFVMLIALGIDYSIFLMDRFNEYKTMEIKEGLLTAMKNMGTVIISAAIILGGTFSAMLPSGVLSILQIATVVLTGLFLYAFVMLPLFVPIMVRIFGKINWWPFMK
ncbi:MAG TPA: MMPL family transporter [Cerasibacillus sp.]|uniref:MMPL family transporter n=1 Tax=Cerasibacillus sp. TaxID=2498711 RepID=UPI002F3F300E